MGNCTCKGRVQPEMLPSRFPTARVEKTYKSLHETFVMPRNTEEADETLVALDQTYKVRHQLSSGDALQDIDMQDKLKKRIKKIKQQKALWKRLSRVNVPGAIVKD